MTSPQTQKEMTDLIFEMVERMPSHAEALNALLAAYTAIALVHPCCTATCVLSLRGVADYIAAHIPVANAIPASALH